VNNKQQTTKKNLTCQSLGTFKIFTLVIMAITIMGFKYHSPFYPNADAVSKVDAVPCIFDITNEVDCIVEIKLEAITTSGTVIPTSIQILSVTSTNPPPIPCPISFTPFADITSLQCGSPSAPDVHQVQLNNCTSYPAGSTIRLTVLPINADPINVSCDALNTHVVIPGPSALGCCHLGYDLYYNGGQFIITQVCP